MPLADLVARVRGCLFPIETLGRRGERAAVKYLKRQGYIILHRGYRILGGELDVVAVDGHTVVFVEVKTRTTHDAGHPAEAVDQNKQRQLRANCPGVFAAIPTTRVRGALRRDRRHLAPRQQKTRDPALSKRVRSAGSRAALRVSRAKRGLAPSLKAAL